MVIPTMHYLAIVIIVLVRNSGNGINSDNNIRDAKHNTINDMNSPM